MRFLLLLFLFTLLVPSTGKRSCYTPREISNWLKCPPVQKGLKELPSEVMELVENLLELSKDPKTADLLICALPPLSS